MCYRVGEFSFLCARYPAANFLHATAASLPSIQEWRNNHPFLSPLFRTFFKPVFRFSLRASRRFPQTKPGRERGYKNRGERRRGEREEKGFPLQKPSSPSPSCKGRFHSTVFNAPPSVLPLSPTNQPSSQRRTRKQNLRSYPLSFAFSYSFSSPPISFFPFFPSLQICSPGEFSSVLLSLFSLSSIEIGRT